jgi:hypothetical protein
MRGRTRQELQGGSDVKLRVLVVTILGVLVALALVIMAPVASAGMVTKIMYAQENSDVYAYPNNSGSTGTLSVSIGWTDITTGVATTFPVGQVDGDIFSGPVTDPYADLGALTSVGTLDEGTNPEVGSYSLPAGQTAYIAVLPYVGDNNYTIDVKFNDTEVAGFPKTAPAYGSSGEVYVPSDGPWISCAQYWPGTSPFDACWYDQVYQRVPFGDSYDTLSEEKNPIFVAPQLTERNTLGGTAPDGSANPKSGEWYSVVPQIWPGAAIPNVVVNGSPKPGTVAATTAPLWYTYSYPDSSVTGSPVAYFWSTLNNSSASKRNYSLDQSTSASFSAQFSGDSLTWVYTTNANCGRANVTIDGVLKATVDQYSPGMVTGVSRTWTGLGSGNHTVVVTNAKTKSAASSNSYVTHDCFLAKGINDPSDPTPALENNYDGGTSYHWTTLNNAAASGGNYCLNQATSAAFAFGFSGTSVTWYYETNANCGMANVYIDGVFEGKVDQYSTGSAFTSMTFDGLADTSHIIFIDNSKTKRAASSNSYITIDAFQVGSTRYEN